MAYVYKTMTSPIGELKLVASQKGLAAILWENDNPDRIKLSPVSEDKNNMVLLETERQLQEYFAKKRQIFLYRLILKERNFKRKSGRLY